MSYVSIDTAYLEVYKPPYAGDIKIAAQKWNGTWPV